MPDFSNVFKPAVDHAHTKPHPFSFEHKYTNKADLINVLVEKDNETAAKVIIMYMYMYMYYNTQ